MSQPVSNLINGNQLYGEDPTVCDVLYKGCLFHLFNLPPEAVPAPGDFQIIEEQDPRVAAFERKYDLADLTGRERLIHLVSLSTLFKGTTLETRQDLRSGLAVNGNLGKTCVNFRKNELKKLLESEEDTTTLNLDHFGLTSFESVRQLLEKAPNLESLSLVDNDLFQVQAISHGNLRELKIGDNPSFNISGIHCPMLERLTLYNPVSIPVLTNLDHLCSFSFISSTMETLDMAHLQAQLPASTRNLYIAAPIKTIRLTEPREFANITLITTGFEKQEDITQAFVDDLKKLLASSEEALILIPLRASKKTIFIRKKKTDEDGNFEISLLRAKEQRDSDIEEISTLHDLTKISEKFIHLGRYATSLVDMSDESIGKREEFIITTGKKGQQDTSLTERYIDLVFNVEN